MIWLRSGIFFLLFSSSVVVFGVPIILLGRLIPHLWLSRIARAWALSVLTLLRVICRLGYRVHGMTNLPADSAIVLCKHQSAWETIAIRALFPLPQTWVLKQELIRIPIFGGALSTFHPIAIDRASGRRAVKQLLDQGKIWLERGRWVIIFPEGTRVLPGERRSYGAGGAMLAERSGRLVVPVAHNAGLFWGRRGFLKYPGVVDLEIGRPIPVEGRRAAEINRDAEQWIESAVGRLPTKR